MAELGGDDGSSSSSSDSDDDFLTTSNTAEGETDREALVRKKLLENFYGKTVSASFTAEENAAVPVNSKSFKSGSGGHNSRRSSSNKEGGGGSGSAAVVVDDDLDSEQFDAARYAAHHLQSSTTHELLETEERLALQVRTLDSTMQTLVYENYSRFIDATDAIRGIGVSVDANAAGLTKLTSRMHRVRETSRRVEDALGSLRDQVAEKIRVQRLLTRLDALLKLPATLRDQIAAGKYRTATKSYLSAASILAKHSEGFESLRSIETECNGILEQLRADLNHKLLHWSGRMTGVTEAAAATSYDSTDEDGGGGGGGDTASSYLSNSHHTGSLHDDDDDAPDPPQSMTEIFEVAGTLYILLKEDEQGAAAGVNDAGNADDAAAANKREDLFSMAVAAAMRLLDRFLDSHLIQVQERRFATMDLGQDIMMMEMDGGSSQHQQQVLDKDGSSLLPREVLDAILEGATLYGVAFGASADADTTSSGFYLMELVTEGFASFLSHVRSILLEESIQASKTDDTANTPAEVVGDATVSSQEEISGALALLVQCVQELASGLALPEVGINSDYAAKLVDQTMELTEWMVRRRVDQRFQNLRLAVARDCLVPFATKAVKERELLLQDGKPVLPHIVQVASSSLSDCLQLVDDAIRSIFSESTAASAGEFDLKDAVHASTYRFVVWLANAFEILAGGDSIDFVVEAPLLEGTDAPPDGDTADELEEIDANGNSNDVLEDVGDLSDREVVDLLDSARDLLMGDEGLALHADFILAIVELCRLSELSVPENLEQSFTAHVGSGKKKSRGIFPTGETASLQIGASREEGEISKRFKLAASRVLVLYTTNCAMEAATILCKDLVDEATKPDGDVATNPSSSALSVLTIAKQTAIECSSVFGGSRRAGPFPKWEDDILPGFSSAMLGRKTGLQLDVERMFKEKVAIYPHPSQAIEASRSSVLFLFFKVVFRALFENARLHTFSVGGYRHTLIDITLFKHVIPHYVNGDCHSPLLMLLSDATEVIEDRCTDESCGQDANLKQEAQDVVKSFVDAVEDSSLADQFIIDEADDEQSVKTS